MRFKLSGLVRILMLLGMMIPIHATLLPNYVIYMRLGILDTIWSLMIPYVAFSLPMGVFLTCGFMNTIPLEMEEAAVIDGCGIFRLIPTIVMPMLKPVMMTVAIMTYLTNWNEFIMAMTFLRSDTWRTLPFSVLQFVGLYMADFGAQFAVMTLGALPAVVIFLLLSKQITKGVALGSIK
jgi:raffinose/stachyose/melibiose transport system permease protein